jgi:hypothetical protein
LGYRQKERKRSLPLSITPGKDSIAEILEQGTMEIRRYEFDDADQLPDYLKRHSLILGLLRAALVRPFEQELPGEGINIEQQAQRDLADETWDEFLNSLRERYGITRNPNAPEPEIRNTAEDEPG